MSSWWIMASTISAGKKAGLSSSQIGNRMEDLLEILITAPFVLAAAGIGDLVDSMKENANKKANKKKYNKALEKFQELSVGKIGTVDIEEDKEQNIKRTIVYTKNGPLVKTEFMGEVAKIGNFGVPIGGDNPEMVKGWLKVSYSGFAPTIDKDGKENMSFVQESTISRESMPQYRGRDGWEWPEKYDHKIISEKGKEISTVNEYDNKIFKQIENYFDAELQNVKAVNSDQEL